MTEQLNKTILVVNVDNSLTSLGLFGGEELIATWSVTTPKALTVDEAETVCMTFFKMLMEREGGQHVDRPADAIIASVVPALTDIWVSATVRLCGGRPLVVGPGLKTGLQMNYSDPAEIGADRIANLVAAKARFEVPLIVVDLSAFTHFAVINPEGAFCGGIIAPGLRLSAEVSSRGAALLSSVDIKVPSSVLGKSTREALQAGIVLGEIARLDGLIEMIWDELGCQTEVIATGSDGATVSSLSKHVNHYEEHLTLQGLNLLYSMNRSKNKAQ